MNNVIPDTYNLHIQWCEINSSKQLNPIMMKIEQLMPCTSMPF